jgi:hypothetical protein
MSCVKIYAAAAAKLKDQKKSNKKKKLCLQHRNTMTIVRDLIKNMLRIM